VDSAHRSVIFRLPPTLQSLSRQALSLWTYVNVSMSTFAATLTLLHPQRLQTRTQTPTKGVQLRLRKFRPFKMPSSDSLSSLSSIDLLSESSQSPESQCAHIEAPEFPSTTEWFWTCCHVRTSHPARRQIVELTARVVQQRESRPKNYEELWNLQISQLSS
jgi:hypothetical protein